VGLHRKGQELALGHAPEHSRHSRIQEPDYRPEHSVRRKGVALMDPEDPLPRETEHDRSVGVGNHSSHGAKAEQDQAIPEQQVRLLTRFPASPLTRLPFAPLRAGSHSP
jgi:hypothetical protein